MNHKRRGTIWLASGLLLILCAVGLTLYNFNQEITAGEEADAVMEELTPILAQVSIRTVTPRPAAEFAPIEDAAAEPVEPVELDGHYYLGVVTFPTLELQLPVQNQWSYANLRVSPCRMAGNPADGNLVILAHNYRTHFGPLDRLEIGDEVSVTLLDGRAYVYSVNAIEVVEPTAVESVTSGEWPLTLFTCTLSGRTRLVIRCDVAE